MNTDLETVREELTYIGNACSWCDYDAVSRYRDCLFCATHLVFFYLALSTEWHD